MKKGLWLAILFAASAFAYTVQVDTRDVQVKAVEDLAFLGYEAVTLEHGSLLPVEPGHPALPALPVMVALPRGTEIESVEATYADPITLPGTYRVQPMQHPTPISVGDAPPTAPNAEVYASAELYPGTAVYAFESGNMGGYGVGSVLLAPVQYVPATGKLIVYRTIDFDVNLRRAQGDLVYPKVRLGWIDRDLRAGLARQVINPWEIGPASGVRLVEPGDGFDADLFPYLIVTDATLAAKAQELADWKTKKGLNAKVVTTSDIESNYTGVDTAEKIRNCIKDYYENYGTQYVCLVGIHSLIPVRKVYDPNYQTIEGDRLVPTDNYYGCLDGNFNADGDGYWGEYPEDNVDWVYDVYVGRIQVSTTSALAEAVDKTLCYEGSGAATETNPYDYQNLVILCGAFLDSSTNEKVLMEAVRDSYLTSSHWTFTELWDNTYPGGSVCNSTNFISNMNAGRGLIAHAAHSNTTVLGTNSGSVTSTNLYNLTNHPKFSGVLYSLGCYPSNTDVDYNCGAYFVSSPDGGGVGFAGNTRYGWYMRGSPANGASADFLKEYFNQFGQNGIYQAGKLMAFHKHPLQSMVSNTIMRYIYFELIHNGDPDVWIPAANIETLTVTYAATIGTGTQTYPVHVANGTDGDVENALVCVWKGDEVYASGTTDASGDVSFGISPTTQGTMYLTVSSHNGRTFEAEVTVSTTGVTLTSFAGLRREGGILLRWAVTEEEKVDSFNLYRRPVTTAGSPAAGGGGTSSAAGKGAGDISAREDEGWARVNGEPILGRSPYRYFDREVPAGVFEYKLEAVLRRGANELGTTQVDGGLPRAFAFHVAPNPARTTANFLLDLPGSTAVKLDVYDLAGRKLATVVDRPLDEGEHAVAFDVSAMPAGIYLLRLEAGDHHASRRLAVVH